MPAGAVDDASIELDLAAGERIEARNCVEERCLSTPGRTDQGAELSRCDVEAAGLQRDNRFVAGRVSLSDAAGAQIALLRRARRT
jgi:hypothetical protein